MNTAEKTSFTTTEQELSAAFIASGMGSAVLGIATTLAEVSEPLRSHLFWFGRGGPLAGETSLAVIVFFVSWAALTVTLRRYPIRLKTAFVAAIVLVLVGLLLTFPPVFRLIAQRFGA
jgi:hypothetical protein